MVHWHRTLYVLLKTIQYSTIRYGIRTIRHDIKQQIPYRTILIPYCTVIRYRSSKKEKESRLRFNNIANSTITTRRMQQTTIVSAKHTIKVVQLQYIILYYNIKTSTVNSSVKVKKNNLYTSTYEHNMQTTIDVR